MPLPFPGPRAASPSAGCLQALLTEASGRWVRGPYMVWAAPPKTAEASSWLGGRGIPAGGRRAPTAAARGPGLSKQPAVGQAGCRAGRLTQPAETPRVVATGALLLLRGPPFLATGLPAHSRLQSSFSVTAEAQKPGGAGPPSLGALGEGPSCPFRLLGLRALLGSSLRLRVAFPPPPVSLGLSSGSSDLGPPLRQDGLRSSP